MKKYLIVFMLLVADKLAAQAIPEKSDTLSEVFVTATRRATQLSSLSVPVTLITNKQIKQMGSVRLNDVLMEQTGLAIINDHGNGIQLQGLNPEYTLILIDGEPLIGRTAGTFELSRITVGNIKQIEIVKGPSSSLYGSEALAGVINIITEKPKETKAGIKARYGSNQTNDLTGDFTVRQKKWGFSGFINRYQTDGYDLTPQSYGKTVEPFSNYTFSLKTDFDVSKDIKLGFSGRYFTEQQTSNSNVGTEVTPVIISGKGGSDDWNLSPSLSLRFSPHFKTQLRFYSSRYSTNSRLIYEQSSEVYDESFFKQTFLRPEFTTEYTPNPKHYFIAGGGYISESVEATRYDDKKKFNTFYGFAQYEWIPGDKFTFTVGGRFDKQSVYGSQFSPKLALLYDINRWLSVKASAGVGFKAPDFRQLYLNFTNAVAGYSVFGSEELALNIARLQAQNQINTILADISQFGEVRAESSVSYNGGFVITPFSKLKGNLNFFRNDIKDLIETQVVATKTNGQNVYSYRNISKVFTQGIESDWTYRFSPNITISLGYQLLYAIDKTVQTQVRNGEVYRRDPVTLETTRVTLKDYGGLFNRSRHSGNIKIFYEEPKSGISTSLRGIYRGKYGLGDVNGNLILDDKSEYVKGYWLWNLSFAKTFQQKITLQTGIDNVLGFTNSSQIPGIAGRLFYLSANLIITKKNK